MSSSVESLAMHLKRCDQVSNNHDKLRILSNTYDMRVVPLRYIENSLNYQYWPSVVPAAAVIPPIQMLSLLPRKEIIGVPISFLLQGIM